MATTPIAGYSGDQPMAGTKTKEQDAVNRAALHEDMWDDLTSPEAKAYRQSL